MKWVHFYNHRFYGAVGTCLVRYNPTHSGELIFQAIQEFVPVSGEAKFL
jgi:hypothetical protein